MEDYRLDQSGQEVQDILDGAAMQVDLTAEEERATGAEQTLQDNIDAEEDRAQGAEGTLQGNIDAEETRAKAAEKQNADDIDAIEEKIPSGASSSNKLATEEYVNDSVATATATFRGTYNVVTDLGLTISATHAQIATALAGAILTADNNDYAFVLIPTSAETPSEIASIERYKFNGAAWGFEYVLNNSGFTAAQWAAINSGITSGDVAKLAALPTNAQLTTLLAGLQSNIDGEATRAQGAEGTLQGNIDAEEARAKAAEKQNADDIDVIEAVLPSTASSENKVATESEINSLSAAIEAILLLIPSAATSLNKLADKAFVNSSIATATATFRGTYNLVNDLGLTTSANHAQIATALAGAILTADNNDYAFVQIPTSDAMPTEIAKTERYKFNGTAWEYEYDLNNSGFTADQWAAINSGITQALVTKLAALPTNAELTTELGTLTSGITAINQKIPNAASQANKLVDTAAMESYIVQVLDVLTISYNVTSTDGHVTLSIEQVDGKITSVTLTTSDIASAADLNLKASQADLTALASRVTTAEGNITSLGGRMTTAEGNITSLGGRMTTAEGNITSLGGRVSTNETDIANLQQLYNNLQQSKPEPVTALPETGQQQGVIYRLAGTTSYSDYMWNGSTWVLMATYNNAIDPRPKKASQNLVTSGGVFDNMGALDVSELNATENPHTLAQYVDLSAALAAIPTDYQKGGMSIKFVHSSDNKYVQYRLMNQSFSTTVADWQGIDDEPTDGSENLVKSNGIYTSLNSINQEIYDITITEDEKLSGTHMYGYISSIINTMDSGSFHIYYYPVTANTNYIIKSESGASSGALSFKLIAFTSSIPASGVAATAVISDYQVSAGYTLNYTPAADGYLCFGVSGGDADTICSYSTRVLYASKIDEIQNDIENIEKDITVFEPSDTPIQGTSFHGYISGIINTSDSWRGWITYFPVIAGDTYFIKSENGASSGAEIFKLIAFTSVVPASGVSVAAVIADYEVLAGFEMEYTPESNGYLCFGPVGNANDLTLHNAVEGDAIITIVSNIQQNLNDLPKTFYVGSDRDFTKLTDGIAEAIKYKNSILYVDAGTYDIIDELGLSYIEQYTEGESVQNFGPKLKNGIHLIFSTGAKVVCNYTGTNVTAQTDFSPFNASLGNEGGGYTIENLNVESSNCRYCVHDERVSTVDDYTHRYINCTFKHTRPNGTNGNGIGTGLGLHGNIEVTKCYFDDCSYYIHNAASAGAKSTVNINNSYFLNGEIAVQSLGNSTEITKVKITSCKVDNITLVAPESGYPVNMEIVEWNNITG